MQSVNIAKVPQNKKNENFLVYFHGTEGPIVFPNQLAFETFTSIVHSWDYDFVDCSQAPWLRILDLGKFWRVLDSNNRIIFEKDPVNTICEIIIELNWSRLRYHGELNCLHAAAVQHHGQLHIIMGAKRSGKSTLCAELARRGYTIFSDDIIPLSYCQEKGVVVGHGSGIAPRVRLPTPAIFSNSLKKWILADKGPFNKQYKYLIGPSVASFDKHLPISGVSFIKRTEASCKIRIQRVDEILLMRNLCHYNFGRLTSSEKTLALLAKLSLSVSGASIEYHRTEDLVKNLENSLQEATNFNPKIHAPPLSMSNSEIKIYERKKLSSGYFLLDGVAESKIRETYFISNPSGDYIFHMNETMSLFWEFLTSNYSLKEIKFIFARKFSSINLEEIERDLDDILIKLIEYQIIEQA